MIRDHKFYEMQSALAAIGQLTEAELKELEDHAILCRSCHECISDMGEVSREFFLMQARRKKGDGLPPGMQERFLQRAAKAGIPVRQSTFQPFEFRFVHIAAIVLILATFTSLSWRVFSFRDAEREGQRSSSTSENRLTPVSNRTSHIGGGRPIRDVSTHKVQLKQRSAIHHSGTSNTTAHRTIEARPLYSESNMLLFAKRDPFTRFSGGSEFWSERPAPTVLTTGLNKPKPAGFTDTYVLGCYRQVEDCKPDARAFHLELKMASLSSLDYLQSIDTRSSVTALKLGAPVFHLDPYRVW